MLESDKLPLHLQAGSREKKSKERGGGGKPKMKRIRQDAEQIN